MMAKVIKYRDILRVRKGLDDFNAEGSWESGVTSVKFASMKRKADEAIEDFNKSLDGKKREYGVDDTKLRQYSEREELSAAEKKERRAMLDAVNKVNEYAEEAAEAEVEWGVEQFVDPSELDGKPQSLVTALVVLDLVKDGPRPEGTPVSEDDA
jgi:hypothetical protein